jgi:ABC-type Fe3+-hydroxamate transport system substrate-binding protein
MACYSVSRMRYVDALKRRVTIKSPPKRIVSLVPSLTEALFVFGVDKAVVGVTNFCVEPREGVGEKPKVGGTKTLNVDRVLELEPELVVASAEENRKEDIQALIDEGLRVYVTLPSTVEEAIELLEQLADMTGAGRKAARVVKEARAALDDMRARNDGMAPVSTFCPIWRNPWMSIGPGTYMHDFVTVCGGANIFAWRHERYPRIELAEMAERNPEVVLLPDEPYRFSSKHVPEIAAFSDVPAVQNGRIYLVDGKRLCWYGPRIASSLRYVSELVRGETA